MPCAAEDADGTALDKRYETLALVRHAVRSGGGDRFRKNKQKMSLNEMEDRNTTNMIGMGGSRLYVGRLGRLH